MKRRSYPTDFAPLVQPLNRLRWSATFIASLTLTAALSAAKYYVSSNGNDSNDGTTPETPWASYEKAHSAFSALEAGDSILFKRGDTFVISGVHSWHNSNCTPEQPITIADYGDPNENRPTIHLETTGFNDTGFYFDNNSDTYIGGFIIKNIIITGLGKSESVDGSRGIRVRGSIQDVLIDNVKVDGLRFGIQFQQRDSPRVPIRVTLRNSEIINIQEYGFIGGGGQDYTLESSFYRNNGSDGTADHHIYVSSTSGETNNLIIRDNEMTDAVAEGRLDSQPIKVAGLIKGCLIENNLIWEDPTQNFDDGGHIVPAIIVGRSNSGSTDEYYEDVTIRNNKVFNIPGLLWSFAGGQNFLVEGNIQISELGSGKMIGIGYAPRSAPDQPLDNVTIRNNEFLFKQTGQIAEAYGIRMPSEGNNHNITGNKIKLVPAYSGWYALDLDGSNGYANYDNIDNNQFHTPNNNSAWEKDEGNLSTWRAATPFDDNSSDAEFTFPYENNPAPFYGFESPLDSATTPTLNSREMTPNGSLTVLLSGDSNSSYTLQTSRDLKTWTEYETLVTDEVGNAIVELEDIDAPSQNPLFLRASP